MTGLINRLFDTFGSLKAILEARPEQLLSVDGMTMSRASMISLVVPLTRVWHRCLMAEPDRIGNSREAEAYCLSLLAGERLENFYVIALNAKCHVLGKRRISMGSLSECSAYPRLVIETALNYNAHSVLFMPLTPGAYLCTVTGRHQQHSSAPAAVEWGWNLTSRSSDYCW